MKHNILYRFLTLSIFSFVAVVFPVQVLSENYFAKNNWDNEDWTWKKMSPDGFSNKMYLLDNAIFGGAGININTTESDENVLWFPTETLSAYPTLEASDYSLVMSICEKLHTQTGANYGIQPDKHSQVLPGDTLCLLYIPELKGLINIRYQVRDGVVASGTCGANLTWTLTCDSVLTISGTGAMYDYEFKFDKAPWYSISDMIKYCIIEEDVTTIGDYAFEACVGLTSITIPNSVTTIGEGAFSSCIGLTSITIPNSVTTIREIAFYCCRGLTSVTIPNSVTTIGGQAFDGCTGLTSVTCKAMTPPTCSDYCFDFVGKHLPVFILLYVPAGSVDAYEGTYPWSEFHGIQPYPSGDDCEPISGTCGTNLTWTLSCDSVLTISGTGDMFGYSTKNYAPWYEYSDKITYCIIEDGVTAIGNYAFYNCIGLTSVNIPNSVTTIGGSVFSGCIGLTSITIPNSVTTIRDWAFWGCSALTTVTIPNSVKTIGSLVFGECTSVTSFNVDSSNTSYASMDGVLFNYTKKTLIQYPIGNTRTQYTIPTSVTEIGNRAFCGCSSLTSIEIPSSVTSIESFAFSRDSSLASITCRAITPPSCGSYCFEYVNTSTSLYVPAGSVDAYKKVWKNFTNIQAIEEECKPISGTCGTNLTWTLSCDSVLTISGKGEMDDYNTKNYAPWYEYSDKITYCIIEDGVTAIGSYAFYNCIGLTSVNIPNSVTTIGEGAFSSCIGLTSITIPNSVTTIGDWAFSSCTGLPSIEIPNSVTTIGERAFQSCEGLISVMIGNSVKTIGDFAFRNCTSLTSITIPNSVTTIGYGAFWSCNGLTSITCEAVMPPTCGSYCFYKVSTSIPVYVPYQSIDAYKQAGVWKNFTNIQPIPGTEPNNVITYTATEKLTETTKSSTSGLHTNAFNVTITSHTFANGVGTITFAGDVTTIGERAFYGCFSLTSITIPNSVTTIGSSAFRGCSGLTSITIPNSVKTIGDNAFYYCTGLTSITIPNSVTTIEYRAFLNCTSLTSIAIPNSVTTIGEGAFESCSGLISVTIPNSVISIGRQAFIGCSSLTSITIGNSVTTIGDMVFYDCSGLTSINVDAANTHYASIDGVLFNYAKDTIIQYPIGNTRTKYTIPSSVTTIGESAFQDCVNLTSITIPNSVTTIGKGAFFYCRGLTSITCEAITPPACDRSCFSGVTTSIPVYVPTGSVDAYKKANEWKDFTNIQPIGGGDDCKTISGTCGANLTWELSCDSVLTINGKGEMYDYSTDKNQAPWYRKVKYCVIEDGVTSIGKFAFTGCTELISVTIPNSMVKIGASAFALCCDLMYINIPSSIVSIGSQAFEACYRLRTVNIPSTVSTIGTNAFRFVNSIVYTGSATGAPWGAKGLNAYIEGDLIYSDKSKTTLVGCFTSAEGDINIPSSVTSIGEYAFYKCSQLTSATIPSSVTTIEDRAFSSCTGLTSITCEAVMPPTCGAYCFQFVSISIPVYVPYKSIDAYKKANEWKNFTNIQAIPGTEPQNNVIIYTASEKLTETTNSSSSGLHTNAFNVTISSHTFANGVGTITFAGDVTTIGDDAFYGCFSLTSITIPNSVTTIRYGAFWSCSGLTSITIPNSVKTIGNSAFQYCRGLTLITIGNSVKTIGENAFIECESLTSINVDTSNKNYISVEGVLFSYAKDTIIQYPQGKTQTEYSIPNSVTTIDGYAFYECSNLISITIPNSVKTIGNSAFQYCRGLLSITIPHSVIMIKDYAFLYCSALTSITCEATTPPSCSSTGFGKNYTPILYVPKGSVNAYKNAAVWKNFYNIQPIGGSEDPDFDINNTTTTVSELEALVTVSLDAKGEVTKYSYWLYLDNAHTDLVCSMDFDAEGKMSNPVIRKAPMREQAEEEQTFDSFTFEVSGLEANTTYYYVLKAFTDAKTFTKDGSFTTQSSSVRNASSQIKKVCKQNQILLEVDGSTYDIWGNLISR